MVPENELKKILSEIEVRLKATHPYLGFPLVKIKLHSFFILNFMYMFRLAPDFEITKNPFG